MSMDPGLELRFQDPLGLVVEGIMPAGWDKINLLHSVYLNSGDFCLPCPGAPHRCSLSRISVLAEAFARLFPQKKDSSRIKAAIRAVPPNANDKPKPGLLRSIQAADNATNVADTC